MRVNGRRGRPRSAEAAARRVRVAKLWSDGVPGPAIAEREGIGDLRSFIQHMRALGFPLARRPSARLSRPPLMGRSVERAMAENGLLRSAEIAAAIVYDAAGRVVGRMDPLSRKVLPCIPA